MPGPIVPFEDLRWVYRQLALHRWQAAKSMPENPHEYTLREEWANGPLFEKVAAFIRRHGYPERFWRKQYTMLALNGMKYWTMGAPLSETTLINRKWLGVDKVDGNAPYDHVADSYDDLWVDDADAQDENDRFADMVADFADPFTRVLDIGCGTGAYLDIIDTPASMYTGIDPSVGMLRNFKEKHPQHECLPCEFEAFVGGPFDLVVALFGTASYITPETLPRIQSMLASGGRYVIMFYRGGTTPRVWDRGGRRLGGHDGGLAFMPVEAKVEEWVHYTVVSGVRHD